MTLRRCFFRGKPAARLREARRAAGLLCACFNMPRNRFKRKHKKFKTFNDADFSSVQDKKRWYSVSGSRIFRNIRSAVFKNQFQPVTVHLKNKNSS